MRLGIIGKGLLIMCATVISGQTRPPAVAGMFYDEDPRALDKGVRALMKGVPADGAGKLRAAVVPHAGYVYSGSCAGAVYGRLKTGDYDRVIILAPSHTRGFRGIALPPPETARFATPLGTVALDRTACLKIAAHQGFRHEPDMNSREHAVEVHLPFLQVALGDSFQLVPLLCGAMNAADLDRAAVDLAPFVTERTLVIASSDFTHYGEDFDYTPFADKVKEHLYEYLEAAAKAIVDRNRVAFRRHCDSTGDTICGRSPIDILLGILDEKKMPVKGQVLAKLTSGDRTGDFRHCVSYAGIGFFSDPAAPATPSGAWSPGLSRDEEWTLMAIARDTLTWVVQGQKGAFDFSRYAITDNMKVVTATFVTLKIHGRLRGCIGSLEPEAPLFQSVHDNAVHAASHDPRFNPVTVAELKNIHVDVSILSPTRDIASWKEFEIGKHGIIMTKGRRRAVYLPEVAPEQGWTVEETLSSLSEKAGLLPSAWKEGAQFQVFESAVISED